MKKILPSLTALALLMATPLAWPAVDTPAPTATAAVENDALPTPTKITRWEETGMKPVEAREWENYAFKPNDALAWKRAGFPPLLARTWSDKGFDPDEAAEWRDSTKNNRTLMADLDQSEPAQWKREGFTPRDRLAWWEAGFAFEDAVTLTRAGMGPADAAWHGHEKLKELRKNDPGAATVTEETPATESSWSVQDLKNLAQNILPHLKTGLIIALGLVSAILAFYLVRLTRRSRHKATEDVEPDSTTPENDRKEPSTSESPPASLAALDEHRRPAQRTYFWTPTTPTCVHCQSTDVRISRIKPRRLAGIKLSEYFRCRSCGRHFSNVSYAPVAAAGIGLVLLLTLCTASFIHLLSLIP